ncbi:PH domain-containing protein [Macrococcoides caseolyticum]|uniref:PH domain-containing protein n=1 Tax=Macrococcoides caseolyticum TaxID=69966 RepID=UPI001F40E9C9|nr:PH domain-containing protein [Macrococcus caseolyticus]MCE4957620.1 PH domain-containing protein [Macrococcus caseolyticus]
MDSTKKSLHYSTYLSNLLKSLKSNIFPIGFGLFLIIKDGFSKEALLDNGFAILILLFTLLSAIFSMIEAKITKYWIEDDKLMLQKGIISRTIKEIYIGKIQTMDSSAGIANQLLGGVIMHIKTAGDGIELNSIGKNDAQALSEYINQRKFQLQQGAVVQDSLIENHEEEDIIKYDEKSYETIYQLSFTDLILMSSTSASMFTVIAVVSAIYSQVNDIFNLDRYLDKLESIVGESYVMVGIIILLALLFSYVIGVFITALKYHQYTVKFDGELINIKYGLFERKNKYIAVKNIQKVTEKQSYLRKLLNKTSFVVTTTSEMKGSEDSILGDEEVLPFINRDDAYQLIQRLVPKYQFDEVNKVIPKRSIRRYFQVSWVIFLIVGCIVQYYWFEYSWLIVILLMVLTLITAFIKYKNSGYIILDDQINVRNGGVFVMQTSFIKEENIIGLDVSSTPFMNRAGLRNVGLGISSGSNSIQCRLDYIEQVDAANIYDWFLLKERRQYE